MFFLHEYCKYLNILDVHTSTIGHDYKDSDATVIANGFRMILALAIQQICNQGTSAGGAIEHLRAFCIK